MVKSLPFASFLFALFVFKGEMGGFFSAWLQGSETLFALRCFLGSVETVWVVTALGCWALALMETRGLEPLTSALQRRRSPN
jgi:hypothetical protein